MGRKSKKIKTECKYCNKELFLTKTQFNRSKNNFCSRECYYKFNVGENSSRFNSDRTHEQRVIERKDNKYYNWRKEIFNRDNFQCVCCGDEKGHNLIAHHKNSYNNNENQRYDIKNGVTLCECCHKKFHKIYGYGNNTEEQFNEFIEKCKENYIPRVPKGGKGIPVFCLTTGKKFNNAKEGAKYYGISSGSHILGACNGKYEKAGSLIDGTPLQWIFYNDYLNNKNVKLKEIKKYTKRKVMCINNGKIYESITDASKKTGANPTCISNVCKGKRKTAGKSNDGTKLVWKYI